MTKMALSRPVFIVLEGLDGCGKSTVARLLAERLDARLLKTPPFELDDIRGRIDDLLQGSRLGRPLFYAAMTAWVADQVRRNLDEGRNTVCDRYYISTLAYAVARGDVLPPSEVHRHLLPPTVTFFLDARAEVRRHRMNRRRRLLREDGLSTEPIFEARLRDAFRVHGPAWCSGIFREIDANLEAPEVLADRMVEIIQEVAR